MPGRAFCSVMKKCLLKVAGEMFMNLVDALSGDVPANSSVRNGKSCRIFAGASEAEIFQTETSSQFSIVQWKNCEPIFATPRPTLTELGEFYSSNYFQVASSIL